MADYAEDIGTLLRNRGLTIGTVESATGGLISSILTNVSGSSHFYKGSIISYRNEIKIGIVGVKAETIEKHGAVSSATAEEMAAGGRKLLGVDICLSDTGIAGPSGATPGKPLGLFYIGFSYEGGTYSRKYNFSGDRMKNRQSAADAALEWLSDFLSGKWVPGLS
jgi:nicotinamide-nucleotide amidase